jgi:hypothetical protein
MGLKWSPELVRRAILVSGGIHDAAVNWLLDPQPQAQAAEQSHWHLLEQKA